MTDRRWRWWLRSRVDPHRAGYPTDDILRQARTIEAEVAEQLKLRGVTIKRSNRRGGGRTSAWVGPELLTTCEVHAPELVSRAKEAQELCWTVAMQWRSLADYYATRWTLRSNRDRNEQPDLFQESMLGLLDAAYRFDPDRGYAFATYAKWWIMAHLARNAPRVVHLPPGAQEKVRRIHQEQAAGTPDAQIAEWMGISIETMEALLCAEQPRKSLESPALPTERDLKIGDILPHPTDVEAEVAWRITADQLAPIINDMEPSMVDALIASVNNGQGALARSLGVSRQAIQARAKTARSKLAQRMEQEPAREAAARIQALLIESPKEGLAVVHVFRSLRQSTAQHVIEAGLRYGLTARRFKLRGGMVTLEGRR